VKAYIQWLITEQSNADIMTATEVLEHLTKIAKRDGYDEIVTAKGDKIQARISTKDQLTALQQLAKFHDLLTPDVQVNNELNIIVDISEPEDDEEEIKQAEAVEDDALEA
ncbi:terminase small subunit, partial [Enterococcus faecium]